MWMNVLIICLIINSNILIINGYLLGDYEKMYCWETPLYGAVKQTALATCPDGLEEQWVNSIPSSITEGNDDGKRM